ncbi:AMIN domain-containing protein [Thermoleptolyngbya sp. PKUAC-SCTB121]|uniref:AMIN domain-containing protein n=1 Tax=Thermoleptolyngbya sp. PKUAC-SCTB121 TaxID=2811482 RepID=UPI001962D009|nr:AMIN domain-containing protein [Thermoleptolyngbya sp. PKUAC-SCTB121]
MQQATRRNGKRNGRRNQSLNERLSSTRLRRWGASLGLAAMAANPTMISLGAIATLVSTTTAAPVQASTLTQWQFDPASTQLEVTVPAGVTPRTFLLAQPTRIVMDLPNTDVGAVPAGQVYGGAVRQVRVSQFQPGLTRIVMELSPDATLAPEQVQLQQVGPASSGQIRWVLRPVLVGATTTATQPVAPSIPPAEPFGLSAAPPVSPVVPQPAAPSEPIQPPVSQPPVSQPQAFPPASAVPQPAPPPVIATTPSQSSPIPPELSGSNTTVRIRRNELPFETLLPSAPPVPVEIPPAAAATAPPASSAAAALQTMPATLQTTPPGATAPSAVSIPTPPSSSASGAWQIPATLPPSAPDGRPVTVTIPPLDAAPAAPAAVPSAVPNAVPSAAPAAAPILPDPLPPIAPAPVASTPEPIVPIEVNRAPASPSPSLPVLQPAPGVVNEGGSSRPSSASRLPAASVAATPLNPNVLLPSGTSMIARYPGRVPLTLSGDRPWQEVLVLTEPVRDYSGRVVFPAGSQLLGRFETNREGSRFVAQAVSVGGRNQRIEARSDRLSGDRRVSEDDILRNSAIGAGGALLLGLLTGGIGLVGLALGAGAGAATTFITAPQPATILPNQIIEVRLTQDVPRGFF